MTRSIAIGLDGASWNVLEPLLQSGELPHLSALRERGASAVLESTVPFYTGPAWASFATASSPAAHGIYDFTMLRERGEMSVARQSDLRRVTYYEQLAREGRRSVLVNLPLDQGESEGSVIVNSWLTVDESRRIFPLDRRQRYGAELASYQNYPTTFTADLETHLADLLELEQRRFELAKALFEREAWDHFFILFSATDWLGHHSAGRFLDDEPASRSAFLRLYRALDGYVGWFVEHAGDATVAVLSDHGQCEEAYWVHVNGVLRERGHVTLLRERPDDIAADLSGVKRQVKLPSGLAALRRTPLVRPLARTAKRVLRRTGVDLVTPLTGLEVDRVMSKAFTPTTASYAIYTRGLSDGEIQAISDELAALRLPDGRPALDGIWTYEELYGRTPRPGEIAPSLIFAPAAGVRPSVRAQTPPIERAADPGRGAHQRDGILLLAGPKVAAGRDLGTVSLYDVTPTLMWTMGAGIPADGDGRVLFEAFEEDYATAQPLHEVDGLDVEREDLESGGESEVTARLRALGYI
jgi:predicted AlkP superfamily phosphohydrolase/phosphomutase